ncbi:MAG TPA: hypothetical protein VM686_40000 [Polyangiaceae bacterium]|nr:hypothetical protein [Polyangiaceae bacterium]
MDRQRQRPARSKSKRRSGGKRVAPEPVLIAARRPNSPLMVKARASASASPKVKREPSPLPPPKAEAERTKETPPKRAVRIVQASASGADEREREREKLLSRLLAAEGRSAVTRAASDYAAGGFEFPRDQPVQLKLLEHLDEELIRNAIAALAELFATEPVTKRPLLEQRLKRLEDTAEDVATRQAASELRRSLRA